MIGGRVPFDYNEILNVFSQHTERTYHNFDRSVRDSQSGYFMLGMDRHQNDFLGGIK